MQEVELNDRETYLWSQQLQRRVIRLLLLYDVSLLQSKFHQIFTAGDLAQTPLLQKYDRYIRLQLMSTELLDDIMPRIRRQLSLKTDQIRLREEAPARGEIDWQRSIERSWQEAPGQAPQKFETRLRHRSLRTPENLLTVAILQTTQQDVQQAISDTFEDEELNHVENFALASILERIERELGGSHLQMLRNEAGREPVQYLAQQVKQALHPGQSSYRDLVHWWERFASFRVGRGNEAEQATHVLTSERNDEKTAAWLYELWIALEYLHLFQEQAAVQEQEIQIVTDRLQYLFSWEGRRFRFTYNRQLSSLTDYEASWEHGPATRPDYIIEREHPLKVPAEGPLIWREPPVVLDAKYYLTGQEPASTHEPIKKLLGDMTLQEAQVGILFFPRIAEPEGERQITRTLQRRSERYAPEQESRRIHLYRLHPTMTTTEVQQRLRAVLEIVITNLPERAEPACHGMCLDNDSHNASRNTGGVTAEQRAVCHKPHIGPDIFDIVRIEQDCLKNPRVCHVIGQPIVPPYVMRAHDETQLHDQSARWRQNNAELLQAAIQAGDEEKAERIRSQLLNAIGHATERYVDLFGDTEDIENRFEEWVFGEYWKNKPRCLAETTRHTLISGEYVWRGYKKVNLQDWAAPAVQYCRALEHELKRRLYNPRVPQYPKNGPGFTIGTVDKACNYKQNSLSAQIWNIFCACVRDSGGDPATLEEPMKRLQREGVKAKRNQLAHGVAITREVAQALRTVIVGDINKPGVLIWLARNLDTTD